MYLVMLLLEASKPVGVEQLTNHRSWNKLPKSISGGVHWFINGRLLSTAMYVQLLFASLAFQTYCRTTPVSQWTVAQDPDADRPSIAVSKWVAREAEMQSQAAAAATVQVEDEAPPPLPIEAPPKRPSTAPVSKWTLVDYDEDNPPDDLEG